LGASKFEKIKVVEIERVKLIDVDSGEEIILSQRPRSYCWFCNRTIKGKEFQLRVDFNDLDINESPTLDAELREEISPGRFKHSKEEQFHHTYEQYDELKGEWRYYFHFEDITWQLFIKKTVNMTKQLQARIIS